MANAVHHLGSLWERLCALPSNQVGEIVGGDLYASPRPAGPHARVTSKLGARLDGPFDSGEGGPGGWIILDEPELHLGDAVLVPDLAGWRRERMPHVPEDLVAFELAPDWVCETLSPKTSTLDRVRLLGRGRFGSWWRCDLERERALLPKSIEAAKRDGCVIRRVFGEGDAERELLALRTTQGCFLYRSVTTNLTGKSFGIRDLHDRARGRDLFDNTILQVAGRFHGCGILDVPPQAHHWGRNGRRPNDRY